MMYVLIASKTLEDHKVHLCRVSECFVSHGILINPAKCVLSLLFLGHHFNSHGVSPLSEQVQVVRDFLSLPLFTS